MLKRLCYKIATIWLKFVNQIFSSAKFVKVVFGLEYAQEELRYYLIHNISNNLLFSTKQFIIFHKAIKS